MKNNWLKFFLFFLFLWFQVIFLSKLFAQQGCENLLSIESFKTQFSPQDSIKRPFRALGMSMIPNATVFSINRYIKKSEFAYINWHTVQSNFMFTSLWDNDMFGTNLLAHPFHGSLDYVGARVNGFNFWECTPYTFGASFIWEFALENEPASFNDQISTTIGGQTLGEMSYRLSSTILDNSATGFQRVVREFFGTLTCPMNGIDRLITGEMWKRKPRPKIQKKDIIPVSYGLDISCRYLVRFTGTNKHSWSPYLHGWMVYGSPYREENYRPLDYFRLDFSLDLSTKSSLLSALNVAALLWGKQIPTHVENRKMMWGVFQHFNYKEKEGMGPDTVAAMRYAEPASVGVGISFLQKYPKTNSVFRGSGHLNLVFLAAAHASNFNLKGRHYNYGQGYSVKLNANHCIGKKYMYGINTSLLQFFTWNGYNPKINISEQNFRKLNTMGDQGNTVIIILRPYFQFNFDYHWALFASSIWFYQYTNNARRANAKYDFLEGNLGMKYTF